MKSVHHHWFHSKGLVERCTCSAPELPAIEPEDVKRYRQIVFPHRTAAFFKPTSLPPPVPGDGFVADLSHERFHEWFGTECDQVCPHRVDPLPRAHVRGMAVERIKAAAPWLVLLAGNATLAIMTPNPGAIATAAVCALVAVERARRPR